MRLPSFLIVAAAVLAAPAALADSGDWTIRFGAHSVDPKSNNGRVADAFDVSINSNVRPTVMLEYFVTRNIGIEVLAALPFKHTVSLNGTEAAEVKHLPPTVSLQYHFAPGARVSPYVGAGVNYTRFLSVRERGPLQGTELDLRGSVGWALHAGLDFRVNERWFVGIDARRIDIDSKARLNGADIGTVNVDPTAYGAYVGYRF